MKSRNESVKRMALWALACVTNIVCAIAANASEPPGGDSHAAAPVVHFNIGLKECAACHSAPNPIHTFLGVTQFVRLVEASEWLGRDKHAYAFELVRQDLTPAELEQPGRKSNRLSIDIGVKLDWKVGDGNFEKKCLTCHVGRDAGRPSEKMDVRFGVQCESCHGPGSEYTQLEHHQQVSWRAKTPEEKAVLGFRDLSSPSSAAAVCLSCHLGSIHEQRFVTHAMYAAGHPVLPPFDLQTFLNAMPPHWKTLQEKSEPIKATTPGGPAFELQAEYIGAHFDIQGSIDEIQLAIQGSYDKTRRSMLGGLAANDLGIELIHQAATEPAVWGDYSIYNCMGCHQELKKNIRSLSSESRIPGRPFPADWLTLEYPAIHVSNRERNELHTREFYSSFNAIPFGDAKRLNQIGHNHRVSLSERLLDRRKMERQFMSKEQVHDWLQFLWKSRRDRLSDYWVAKQTAWMVLIAVDELVEHSALQSYAIAPLRDELRAVLRLELRRPQRQSVIDDQKEVLETARSFDPVRVAELLGMMVAAATSSP